MALMQAFSSVSSRARRWLTPCLLGSIAALALTAHDPGVAQACGCTHPPVPSGVDDYAVNQGAEQIIFEVEGGFVTAHVLISYVGDPAQFAWIVPVPSVPELALTESILFGLLNQGTAPSIQVQPEWLCPDPEYYCEYHPPPQCGTATGTGTGTASGTGTGSGSGGQGSGGGSGGGNGVDIIKKEQIGSYDTYVFSAGDAGAAVAWLQAEGFIVNNTMTPYMQPYADAGMLFVAAKLIPGAGAEEIRPLKMKYAAAQPMIPLGLTAIAAEPHMAVTTYVFGDTKYAPDGRPLVEIDPTDISTDLDGRNNYPMVMSRAIDGAGREAFVMEYAGGPPTLPFENEFCCEDGDPCGLEGDAVCQCPVNAFDTTDCESIEGLIESVEAYASLREAHTTVTRLTTRVSPEEMNFDPMFAPSPAAPLQGNLSLVGSASTLSGCEPDVVDAAAYQDMRERQACTSMYCGMGECVITTDGAGCRCDAGSVARRFTDLDGLPSVTCVPETGTVDFEAAGITLPDACANQDCGAGTCLDVGGFPTCHCDSGTAAAIVAPSEPIPRCMVLLQSTGTSGARDYSAALESLAVCAPTPPSCGEFGWLVPNPNKSRQGVLCASSFATDEQQKIPPKPTCEDLGLPPPGGDGGGGSGGGGDSAIGGGGGSSCRAAGLPNQTAYGLPLLGAGLLWLARRRRRSVRPHM